MAAAQKSILTAGLAERLKGFICDLPFQRFGRCTFLKANGKNRALVRSVFLLQSADATLQWPALHFLKIFPKTLKDTDLALQGITLPLAQLAESGSRHA